MVLSTCYRELSLKQFSQDIWLYIYGLSWVFPKVSVLCLIFHCQLVISCQSRERQSQPPLPLLQFTGLSKDILPIY